MLSGCDAFKYHAHRVLTSYIKGCWMEVQLCNVIDGCLVEKLMTCIYHGLNHFACNLTVPFNAVVLGTGLMLAEDITDEQREILKMMDASSSSMIRILNDVLDMGVCPPFSEVCPRHILVFAHSWE